MEHSGLSEEAPPPPTGDSEESTVEIFPGPELMDATPASDTSGTVPVAAASAPGQPTTKLDEIKAMIQNDDESQLLPVRIASAKAAYKLAKEYHSKVYADRNELLATRPMPDNALQRRNRDNPEKSMRQATLCQDARRFAIQNALPPDGGSENIDRVQESTTMLQRGFFQLDFHGGDGLKNRILLYAFINDMYKRHPFIQPPDATFPVLSWTLTEEQVEERFRPIPDEKTQVIFIHPIGLLESTEDPPAFETYATELQAQLEQIFGHNQDVWYGNRVSIGQGHGPGGLAKLRSLGVVAADAPFSPPPRFVMISNMAGTGFVIDTTKMQSYRKPLARWLMDRELTKIMWNDACMNSVIQLLFMDAASVQNVIPLQPYIVGPFNGRHSFSLVCKEWFGTRGHSSDELLRMAEVDLHVAVAMFAECNACDRIDPTYVNLADFFTPVESFLPIFATTATALADVFLGLSVLDYPRFMFTTLTPVWVCDYWERLFTAYHFPPLLISVQADTDVTKPACSICKHPECPLGFVRRGLIPYRGGEDRSEILAYFVSLEVAASMAEQEADALLRRLQTQAATSRQRGPVAPLPPPAASPLVRSSTLGAVALPESTSVAPPGPGARPKTSGAFVAPRPPPVDTSRHSQSAVAPKSGAAAASASGPAVSAEKHDSGAASALLGAPVDFDNYKLSQTAERYFRREENDTAVILASILPEFPPNKSEISTRLIPMPTLVTQLASGSTLDLDHIPLPPYSNEHTWSFAEKALKRCYVNLLNSIFHMWPEVRMQSYLMAMAYECLIALTNIINHAVTTNKYFPTDLLRCYMGVYEFIRTNTFIPDEEQFRHIYADSISPSFAHRHLVLSENGETFNVVTWTNQQLQAESSRFWDTEPKDFPRMYGQFRRNINDDADRVKASNPALLFYLVIRDIHQAKYLTMQDRQYSPFGNVPSDFDGDFPGQLVMPQALVDVMAEPDPNWPMYEPSIHSNEDYSMFGAATVFTQPRSSSHHRTPPQQRDTASGYRHDPPRRDSYGSTSSRGQGYRRTSSRDSRKRGRSDRY